MGIHFADFDEMVMKMIFGENEVAYLVIPSDEDENTTLRLDFEFASTDEAEANQVCAQMNAADGEESYKVVWADRDNTMVKICQVVPYSD